MNKQAFLSGQIFKIANDNDKVYQLDGTDKDDLSISSYHFNSKGEMMFKSYVCNVNFVGTRRFQGYTFIMGKRVVIEYYYEHLTPFTPLEVVED